MFLIWGHFGDTNYGPPSILQFLGIHFALAYISTFEIWEYGQNGIPIQIKRGKETGDQKV